MTTRQISQGGYAYSSCPAALGPAAHRARAVMQARLVDELTGLGVQGGVVLRSSFCDLASRNMGGGGIGFVANSARRFTDLVANAATIDLILSASRYLPRAMAVDLGPFNTGLGDAADFPDYFEPIDLGDIAMHRMAVRLSGHAALEIGATRAPLAGVDISITGIWSTEPGPDDDAGLLVEAPEIVSLAPGLYRDRPSAANTLRAININVLGPAKRLLRPIGPGAVTLELSDQIGLVVGDLLAFAPGELNDAEFIQVAAIDGGLSADEAATITLEHPVKRARRADEDAWPAAQAPGPGPQAAFARDGLVGDETVPLVAIPAGLPDINTVEIAGDGVPEYHVAQRYVTQTDVAGAYRLPPVARVARLTVAANRADFIAPINLTVGPAYATGVQQVDFLLRP